MTLRKTAAHGLMPVRYASISGAVIHSVVSQG